MNKDKLKSILDELSFAIDIIEDRVDELRQQILYISTDMDREDDEWDLFDDAD